MEFPCTLLWTLPLDGVADGQGRPVVAEGVQAKVSESMDGWMDGCSQSSSPSSPPQHEINPGAPMYATRPGTAGWGNQWTRAGGIEVWTRKGNGIHGN
jgi:hypothetical protein